MKVVLHLEHLREYHYSCLTTSYCRTREQNTIMIIKYDTNQMLPSHTFMTQIREVYHNRGDIIYLLG